MNEVDLFAAEAQALQRANDVLAATQPEPARYRAALEELVQHYGQLMRQSRRLISRSDRTERELNLLNARLKQLSDELDYKARHDNLTGVLNRGAVFERAHQILEKSAMSLIVLDIDFFKRINDEFGHPAGDAVIRELVARLRAALGEMGVIGRVGGEEFTILLPGWALEQAVVLAGRLRLSIAAERFSCLPARPVTSSFGVAWAEGGDAFEAAYARADQALYQAKRGGRNRVESEATVTG